MSGWRWGVIPANALGRAQELASSHGVSFEELSVETQRLYLGVAAELINGDEPFSTE
jgi:hypothetical protein